MPVSGHFCPGASLSPEECQEGGETWKASLSSNSMLFCPKTLPRSHSCPSLLWRKGRKLQQTVPRLPQGTRLAGISTSPGLIHSSDQKNQFIPAGRLKACEPKGGGFQEGQGFSAAASEDEIMMFSCSVSGFRLHFVQEIWQEATG